MELLQTIFTIAIGGTVVLLSIGAFVGAITLVSMLCESHSMLEAIARTLGCMPGWDDDDDEEDDWDESPFGIVGKNGEHYGNHRQDPPTNRGT